MSKRKRRSRDRMVTQQREYLHITTPKRAVASYVRSIEDRRNWNPLDEPHPAGYLHRSARLVVSQPNVNKTRDKNEVPHRVQFAVPDEVAVCVRRKSRREVLFAMGKTGKGAKQRKRRRNYTSNMEC